VALHGAPEVEGLAEVSREIKNARIRRTMLGWEDHGIFTCMIDLDYDGGGQGFGGYGLDRHNGERSAKSERLGTAYGLQFVMEICRVVGVEKWEDLPGKYVRADAAHEKVYRIGHITADKWFDPAELFAKMGGDE